MATEAQPKRGGKSLARAVADMGSYETQVALQGLVAGDTRNTIPTIDELSQLKLLHWWTKTAATEGTDTKNPATMAATESMYFINRGLAGVTQNPALGAKFGTDLQGGLALGAVLKKRSNARVYDRIMDDTLGDTIKDDLVRVNSQKVVRGLGR